jgi:hypothetical protein
VLVGQDEKNVHWGMQRLPEVGLGMSTGLYKGFFTVIQIISSNYFIFRLLNQNIRL